MENDAATVETAVPLGHTGSHRTQQQVLSLPHNLGRVRTTVTPCSQPQEGSSIDKTGE